MSCPGTLPPPPPVGRRPPPPGGYDNRPLYAAALHFAEQRRRIAGPSMPAPFGGFALLWIVVLAIILFGGR